jgi:pimeloyl-ACP methyl ester carboxylesterase
MNNNHPEYLLFAQHGWADTGNDIGKLAQAVASSQAVITVPSLGLIKTFIRIEPLVKRLEQIATKVINEHPQATIRIIGHSMGGLMWLEVLYRNPQWWSKVHSLILLGSPVGGSNIARIIDPLNMGIGTARDLGKNRRAIAEKIAQQIPTLSVASDFNMGSDGLVTLENTKFAYANWLFISGIPHHALKFHSKLIPIIQNFWTNPQLGLLPTENFANQVIKRLRSIPGMTDADYWYFKRSQIVARFPDDITIHTWNHPLGISHVFVGREKTQCLYAGYVGLLHILELRQALKEICQSVS